MRSRRTDPAPAVVEPAPEPPRKTTPLDGVTLPKFTGPGGQCAKCNATKAKTQFYPAKMTCNHLWERYVHGQERLHRTCRCGWSWDEACYQPEDKDGSGHRSLDGTVGPG